MLDTSRRGALKLAFAVAIAGAATQIPIHPAKAQDAAIEPSSVGEKPTLCRRDVEEEVRARHLRIWEALEKTGAEISPRRREKIIEQAIDRTLVTLRKEYKFID